MPEIQIYKEESDTTLKEISKAEKIWGTEFPEEYKDFLLKNNGGVPYPNCIEGVWEVERFLSIGDIILQKLHPMPYTWNAPPDEDDLIRHNLKSENLLTFAIGEEGGCYFMDLDSNNFSQLYYCNYAGREGVEKIGISSFKNLINSLDEDELNDEEIAPNFKLTKLHYSHNKIFKHRLFETPNKPQLGFERFKEIFQFIGDIQPPKKDYPNIPQKYINDKVRLEYLLKKGCTTEGLLRYARNPQIIKYLIEEVKLDINKIYRGRYPLQNYLTSTANYYLKPNCKLIADLLEMKIEMDWSIKGTQVDGSPDLPMIEKLEVLYRKSLKMHKNYDKWWTEEGNPNYEIPFIRNKLIEEKLGITNDKDWFSRISEENK